MSFGPFGELRRQTEGHFIFCSERGGPMTRSNVSKTLEAAAQRAGLPYRHTRRLQLWLGHADIKHTARYSELSAKPFKDFWK